MDGRAASRADTLAGATGDRGESVDGEPSNTRIIGVALVLFCGILLGVGIHHMVSIGTCSSTGYSANYGPVKFCPAGTGWWFAFLFGGIIGGLIGALMAGSVALVFAGIFGGIGFGALTIALDAHPSAGTKIFGAVFGGCFAIVGVIAGIFVLRSAFGALRSAGGGSRSSGSGLSGSGSASSGLGGPGSSGSGDAIMGAYNAGRTATPPAPPRPLTPTPLNLVPGLQAAKRGGPANAVDELEKLAELHKRGAVTDAEFASAKAKLLGEM